MPHQNRVTPLGEIIATHERGTLYGNRGCLVNNEGKIVRPFKELRWIICVLVFKGRRHPMMAPGRYTGLFFLDEATALAAGHRPCAECQRERFEMFRSHWAKANSEYTDSPRPLAPVIDAVLHKERLGLEQICESIGDLPDGTFVTCDDREAYLVKAGNLLRWTPGGYEYPEIAKIALPLKILTPESIVRVLKAGYPVELHSTVFGS
ncbi:hypothetical protein BH10ACI2_BH10ACI2_08880 [soil metagenome]